jgi:hypothetical protein
MTRNTVNAIRRIDSIRLSKGDRRVAEQYLRSGEFLGGLIYRACGNLRYAAAIVSKSLAPY